jgi:hypothetical protein
MGKFLNARLTGVEAPLAVPLVVSRVLLETRVLLVTTRVPFVVGRVPLIGNGGTMGGLLFKCGRGTPLARAGGGLRRV